MARPPLEPVFTRRSFIFFLCVAPLSLLTVGAIILVLQYRQLKGIVSNVPLVTERAWTAADSAAEEATTASLRAFAAGRGPDSLALPPADLDRLVAASPVTAAQKLRARVTANDTLLVVESTQSLFDQDRKFSWVFKKIVPREFQYVNARMEGLPEWKDRKLSFQPERGTLNGGSIPRSAITKRGGLSTADFVDPAGKPFHDSVLARLDTVLFERGRVVLVRRAD